MSLEYSMFRFSDDYPTAEGLSEMIMQVCMDDERQSDNVTRLIRSLVQAAHELRWLEALAESDEDEADIPAVWEPGELFMQWYERSCRAAKEACHDGDAWWEEWWPTNCPWHPDDIAHLARLKAGQTRTIRRQLRAEWAKHKGSNDETQHA